MANSSIEITAKVRIGPKCDDLVLDEKKLESSCGSHCCYPIGPVDTDTEQNQKALDESKYSSPPQKPYELCFGLMPAYSKPKFLVIKVEYYQKEEGDTEQIDLGNKGDLFYKIGNSKKEFNLENDFHLYEEGAIQALGDDLSKIKFYSKIDRRLRLLVVFGWEKQDTC